jgi:signal transduction histidine kinase
MLRITPIAMRFYTQDICFSYTFKTLFFLIFLLFLKVFICTIHHADIPSTKRLTPKDQHLMTPVSNATPPHSLEAQRLAALNAYGLFGTASEDHFDEIVALAAEICGSSTALMSLVGEDMLWFKSRYGYVSESAPRENSFCSHAILHDEMLIVEDALRDERFANNPTVNCPTGGVRFYAGAPLTNSDGLRIGVICAIDDQPKQLSALQIKTLQVLANQIVAQMELHKSLHQMHLYTEKMKQLNENKDKFFSIIAHDLRAAFHGILGFSEVLDTEFDELDTDAIRKIASYLNHSSQSTFKLLENLLEWAMLENGSMRFRPDVIRLESIIDTVVTGLDLSATQKNLSISFQVDASILVFADTHMMQSLFHNLVSNAIKFTDRGGKISINQTLVDKIVQISIEDNGMGMSERQIHDLFKVETSQSTKGTLGEVGTGLGLLLCKQFIEQHGGSISVKSTLGQGSAFLLTLPLHSHSEM